MTIGEALIWARRRLQASPTPHEDARLLLQHLLDAGHAYLVAHPEQSLTTDQERLFRALVARAQQLEPIPYITGEAPFYGLDFIVTPDVLIPRPETEQLVERAISWAQAHAAQRLVDVGTGSGCIAVVLARRLPHASILATDVSAAALDIARRNALRHEVADRLRFHEGTLLEGLTTTVDLVVANLPYISDSEWTVLDDAVKWYEPVGALRGGPDGLDLIGRLLRQVRSLLRPNGAVFLEIGWRQGDAARQLAQTIFPAARITVQPDYAGHDRMVIIDTSTGNNGPSNNVSPKKNPPDFDTLI